MLNYRTVNYVSLRLSRHVPCMCIKSLRRWYSSAPHSLLSILRNAPKNRLVDSRILVNKKTRSISPIRFTGCTVIYFNSSCMSTGQSNKSAFFAIPRSILRIPWFDAVYKPWVKSTVWCWCWLTLKPLFDYSFFTTYFRSFL